ncbi:Retinoblastoma-binding protein 5 [Agyrium rufum]|nr:Retinoblastoma-binding protein 5 [Agyrium rufum]
MNDSAVRLMSSKVDGVIVIFDVETYGIAHKLRGHTRQIQSISLLFVVSLFEDQPQLVDASLATAKRRVLPSAPRQELVGAAAADAKPPLQEAKHATCVTIFTAHGTHVIAGTSKGWLNIIDSTSCQTIYSIRICNAVVILLRLASSGRDMAVKVEVEHKFQDVVNRLSWNHVAFSSTGEYVTASTYMNHDIYVWERNHGSLVKILEGPKEELGVIEWHPNKPVVAACGLETGRIYLWSIITPQRWSALAPDFAEVEENVEYVEHEDEFDVHPIEEIHKRRLDLEDESVDVLSVEPAKGDLDQSTFKMPILLEMDSCESEEEIVAVGPGTMRRKSPGDGMYFQ